MIKDKIIVCGKDISVEVNGDNVTGTINGLSCTWNKKWYSIADNSLICLRPYYAKEMANEALEKTVSVIRELGLNYYLRDGTCLGFTRDGNYIPWDYDIDVTVIIPNESMRSQLTDRLHEINEFRLREAGLNQWWWWVKDNKTVLVDIKYDMSLGKKLDVVTYNNKEYNIPYPIKEYLEGRYFKHWNSQINVYGVNQHVEDDITSPRTRVGYAFVVCDLLHYGHLNFFRQCRKHCDFLIVGVYTDELTMSYKRKPVIPFEQRIELVKALKPVDMVVRVENKDCTSMLKRLTKDGWNIKRLFHGDDWIYKMIGGRDYIKEIGGELVLIPYTKNISTSTIIGRIKRK